MMGRRGRRLAPGQDNKQPAVAAAPVGLGEGGGGESRDGGNGPEELTLYERERAARISQNAALLKSLGIDQAVQSVRRAAARVETVRRDRATPRKRRAASPPTPKTARSATDPAGVRGTRSRGGRLSGGADVDEAVLEERMRRFVESEDEAEVLEAGAWGQGDDDEGVLLGDERVNVLPSHKDELDEGEKEVYDALRGFCAEKAEDEGLEIYQVAQHRSLCEMVRMRPQSDSEMLLVWGMGAVRTEKYGGVLLKILGDMRGKLREGPRPVLDAQAEDGIVHVAEGRKRLGGAVKKQGDAWKRLEWADLDRLKAGAGLLVLRHNASKTYRRNVVAGDSLNEALQTLARAGKKTGNPKITGFIKVVDNAFFNDLPLSVILENWVCSRKGFIAASEEV